MVSYKSKEQYHEREDFEMNKPEMCYVFVESSNEIGIVKWGESGYYRTTISSSIENKKHTVKELNERHFEIDELEAEAMMICSMNDNLKAEDWEKHYDFVLSALRKEKV